jgi:chromatin modification-related protein VID21
VDFAEERRWKVGIAREFAFQCVEWHLASEEEKASLMVGGRGWGEANGESIPGNRKQQTSMDLDERMSDGAAADAVDEAEDDVEMLVQPEGEESFGRSSTAKQC